MNETLEKKLHNITTFVFDIDGVFTDATITVTNDDVTRVFNVRDGYAVQMALKSKFNIAIISGGKQESIRTRMNTLGVEDVYLSVGTADKPQALLDYLTKKNLKPEEVLFVGDDIPDLLIMQSFPVLSCCPLDAVSEVKLAADYIGQSLGGRGIVREVIEWVMKTQNKWMKVL